MWITRWLDLAPRSTMLLLQALKQYRRLEHLSCIERENLPDEFTDDQLDRRRRVDRTLASASRRLQRRKERWDREVDRIQAEMYLSEHFAAVAQLVDDDR